MTYLNIVVFVFTLPFVSLQRRGHYRFEIIVIWKPNVCKSPDALQSHWSLTPRFHFARNTRKTEENYEIGTKFEWGTFTCTTCALMSAKREQLRTKLDYLRFIEQLVFFGYQTRRFTLLCFLFKLTISLKYSFSSKHKFSTNFRVSISHLAKLQINMANRLKKKTTFDICDMVVFCWIIIWQQWQSI